MSRLVFPLLLLVSLFAGCEAQTYKIATPNMAPTLKVGEVRKATKIGEDYVIKRFDVVVFNLPEEVRKVSGDPPGSKIISRIVALPGEKVEVKEGKVYINDELLAQPFKTTPDTTRNAVPVIVPENEFYMLGDNRPESLDSRYWKKPTIARSEISAKIEGIE